MKSKKGTQVINAHDLQKDKILKALTVSKDISEASKVAGVTRKTIYSYLKDNDFVIAYRNLKRTELRELSEKISCGAVLASNFLIGILDDVNAAPSVKLQASTKLLEFYFKFMNVEANINSDILEESENSFDIFKVSSGL